VNIRVTVCLPRDAVTVPLLRGVVGDALKTFGVTAECVNGIQLALSEACTNVIEHAAADDEYEVGIDVDERQCAIRVTNARHSFDTAALEDEMPDPSSPRGRGVAIMRAFMDDVEFISEPEAGTIVRLVKVLALTDGAPLARLTDMGEV
jgi:serine/threonine-protein kinase RsbW